MLSLALRDRADELDRAYLTYRRNQLDFPA